MKKTKYLIFFIILLNLKLLKINSFINIIKMLNLEQNYEGSVQINLNRNQIIHYK